MSSLKRNNFVFAKQSKDKIKLEHDIETGRWHLSLKKKRKKVKASSWIFRENFQSWINSSFQIQSRTYLCNSNYITDGGIPSGSATLRMRLTKNNFCWLILLICRRAIRGRPAGEQFFRRRSGGRTRTNSADKIEPVHTKIDEVLSTRLDNGQSSRGSNDQGILHIIFYDTFAAFLSIAIQAILSAASHRDTNFQHSWHS